MQRDALFQKLLARSFDTPQRKECLRFGSWGGKAYLDLGDTFVEIAAGKWQLVDTTPEELVFVPSMAVPCHRSR